MPPGVPAPTLLLDLGQNFWVLHWGYPATSRRSLPLELGIKNAVVGTVSSITESKVSTI